MRNAVLLATTLLSAVGYAQRFGLSKQFSPPFAYEQPAVLKAPYCADEEVEWPEKQLPDGHRTNRSVRIERRMCRDALGRTREETPLISGPGAPMVTLIHDPVARVQYTIDPLARVVHRFRLGEDAGETSARLDPTLTFVSRAGGPSTRGPQFEDLGTDTIDGIRVEGKRITVAVPGPDGPGMRQVTETWVSPELKIQIVRKTTNPSWGTQIVRLVNLLRNDPDPALFQTPAGYTIVDETGPFTIAY